MLLDGKREGKKGHFRGFSGPWLAQASLWLVWTPRLLRGEGTSSPERANLLQDETTTLPGELPWPLMPSFAINRREGGWVKGSKVQHWEKSERRRRRKKRKTRSRRGYRIATVIDFDIVLHLFFAHHLVSFCFKRSRCFYFFGVISLSSIFFYIKILKAS